MSPDRSLQTRYKIINRYCIKYPYHTLHTAILYYIPSPLVQWGYNNYVFLFFDGSVLFYFLCHSGAVKSQVSLESEETAGGTFTCSAIESKLTHCFEERPYNSTCRHLLLSCVEEHIATTSSPPGVSPEGNFPPSSPSSRVGQPAPSSTQFPVVGMIVGVFSALLLVGVVVVIAMIYGVFLWRRSKSDHLALNQRWALVSKLQYQ